MVVVCIGIMDHFDAQDILRTRVVNKKKIAMMLRLIDELDNDEFNKWMIPYTNNVKKILYDIDACQNQEISKAFHQEINQEKVSEKVSEEEVCSNFSTPEVVSNHS